MLAYLSRYLGAYLGKAVTCITSAFPVLRQVEQETLCLFICALIMETGQSIMIKMTI